MDVALFSTFITIVFFWRGDGTLADYSRVEK